MDKIIMYDSPEAAKPHTMQGWLSSTGLFYKDEDVARYAGCTHRACECGKAAPKSYIKCDDCRHLAKVEKYNALPFEEWNGETLLYSELFDKYYSHEEEIIDDIEEFKEENGGVMPNLMLLICEPLYYSPIESGYWEDVLAEDVDICDKLEVKLNELNEFIKALPPASWEPGKIRTKYEIELADEKFTTP